MSQITISGNASGSGTFTIASPNSNSSRTLTLPDATGTFNTSGAVNEVPAGSASAPSIYPTGDSNNGIFFPTTDATAITTAGTERMRIDSSGNVGIGTSSIVAADGSARTFQIGDRTITQSVVGTQTLFANNAYYDGTWKRAVTGVVSAIRLSGLGGGTTGGDITFTCAPNGTAGTTLSNWDTTDIKMVIKNDGNVGIGTSTPTGKLCVETASSGTQTLLTLRVPNATNNNAQLNFSVLNAGSDIPVARIASVYGAADNIALAFSTFNSGGIGERMRIDKDGNVGIGTSSPGSKLVVEGNVATGLATGSQLLIRRTTNTTHVAGLCFANGLSRGPILGTLANSDDLVVGETDGATFYERMRIKSAENNVLIGCTANPSSSVVGVRLGQSGSQGFGASAAGGTGTLEHWYYYNTNGQVGSITTNGSATAYNTSSDRRLKENIAPAEQATEIVNAIQIVQHDWKAGGHTRFGVVAQDLNKIYSEAVAVGDDGEKVEKTWGVDYSKLVPVLTKAIQEQQAQIEALKAEVAALKGV